MQSIGLHRHEREIALEVGYGSYKTFSRIFRESKGIVPKDYRKAEHGNRHLTQG